jgi:hypothetical protein
LVDTYPGFAQTSFEKWKRLLAAFLQEFRADLRNVLTNRKGGIALAVFRRVGKC